MCLACHTLGTSHPLDLCPLLQALLKDAGKSSVLGSMEENDPDADDDDSYQEEDGDAGKEVKSSSVVDKITDLLGKTGLTSS